MSEAIELYKKNEAGDIVPCGVFYCSECRSVYNISRGENPIVAKSTKRAYMENPWKLPCHRYMSNGEIITTYPKPFVRAIRG